ncbi:baseplate J/gp47 family protein [Schinkia sp. CFF1]
MKPRFNLPEITFAEKSAQQIEADMIKAFEDKRGVKLGLADPRRKFIQALVPILMPQRNMIDYSSKQRLLAYATGAYLDHIGAGKTERLQPTYSKTTIRLNLTTLNLVTIPSGTRATPGNGVFFMSTKEVTTSNQPFVDIEFQCTVAGSIGNGYLPGEINALVDPLQWVSSVENITESEGGSDAEDDDSYAERIRIAPESYSTAGPDGAYKFWAKTANPLIVDVYVGSPAPCEIEIRTLLKGGINPDQEILDTVLEKCSNRTVRPLTDFVSSLAPERVSYDINMTYWIHRDNASRVPTIQKQVNLAVEDYKLWQKSKFGRSIDPSELTALVKNAGAKRVSIPLPLYQAIAEHQVPLDNLITVTYGGLEDD